MQRRTIPAVSAPATTAWPADTALDAHPAATWLLESCADLWIRTLYDRSIVLPDDFHVPPGTMIASNHQRDVDGPMLGVLLAQRRGFRFAGSLVLYATREDLFRPGILARLTVHWPRPVSALLGCISLAWFFPLGRTEPMRRVREFTLGEVLHALCDAGCGDDECRALLNARGRRETGIAAGRTTPRSALARKDLPLEAWWGLRRLTLPAFRKLAPAFRATIDAQLAHFATRLDRGHCVYFSPEGTISKDGRFGRIRGGFFRLARLADSPPWIQPVALSYDTLAPGRSRVVIRVGNGFRADTALDRCAFDAGLRSAVTGLITVTPSHLLARFLMHGPATFSEREFAEWLVRGREALQAISRPLDPQLMESDAILLARRRLRWLCGKGLVARTDDGFRTTMRRETSPGWRKPANVVRYLDNSLSDLVPGVDRVLPC